MSLIDIKNKYDIAIDGQGYMLKGTPESPRYRCNQGTVFNQRFAQGDRSYEDFSQYWFVRQTDWYQGFKSDKSWADDGKFYMASNIDTSSELGQFALHYGHDADAGTTVNATITTGSDGLVSADSGKFIGTIAVTSDVTYPEPHVWKEGTPWTDMWGDNFARDNSHVSCLHIGKDDVLWVGLSFTEATSISTINSSDMVLYNATGEADPSAWVDVGTDIRDLLDPAQLKAYSPIYEEIYSCNAFVNYQDTLYIGVTSKKRSDGTSMRYHIVSTDSATPTVEGDFSHVVTGHKKKLLAMCELGGSLYYLVVSTTNTKTELWKYDIAADLTTIVSTFQNTNYNHDYNTNKYLFVLNNKVIIVVPDNEVWEYDGSTLQRIYNRDITKSSLDAIYQGSLYYGGMVVGNKAYFVNMIYDGENFHNWIKDPFDSSTAKFYPLFVTTDNKWYGSSSGTPKTLYGLGTASYKGTADQNYIIFNQVDTIAGIDKTAYHVDIIFDKFDVGEKIKVSYCTDDLTSTTTWTELGSASYAVDGANTTQKRLTFPSNITFRKIWFRVDMEGDGSSTPKLKDFIFAYLPNPNQDAVWTLTINGGDYVETLQKERSEVTGREIKEKLWLLLRNQQTIDFQDVNYASTTTTASLATTDTTISVTSTDEFPEAGRLMIDDVVYYYTGKTQTTFTGVTQGEKNTIAVAKNSGSTVHNGYKARITTIDTVMPTGYRTDERKNEYEIQVSLREIL